MNLTYKVHLPFKLNILVCIVQGFCSDVCGECLNILVRVQSNNDGFWTQMVESYMVDP